MSDGLTRRVLVVDDLLAIHEDFRRIVAAAVSADDDLSQDEAYLFGTPSEEPHESFDLDFAFQGREALDMVIEAASDGRPYDLAIVDMRMPPGWNGVETIARIWQADPALPVILCTAYTGMEWDTVRKQLDADGRLTLLRKPFEPEEAMRQMLSSCGRERVPADDVKPQPDPRRT